MTFLVSFCACGWTAEDLNEEETIVGCVRCGRIYTNKGNYWSSDPPTKSVDTLVTPKDRWTYYNDLYWCYTSLYKIDRDKMLKEYNERLANKDIK
jgi:hypothetical protein